MKSKIANYVFCIDDFVNKSNILIIEIFTLKVFVLHPCCLGILLLNAGSRKGNIEVVLSLHTTITRWWASPCPNKWHHSLFAAKLKIWKKDYRSFEDKEQLASSSHSMGLVSTKTLVMLGRTTQEMQQSPLLHKRWPMNFYRISCATWEPNWILRFSVGPMFLG